MTTYDSQTWPQTSILLRVDNNSSTGLGYTRTTESVQSMRLMECRSLVSSAAMVLAILILC